MSGWSHKEFSNKLLEYTTLLSRISCDEFRAIKRNHNSSSILHTISYN